MKVGGESRLRWNARPSPTRREPIAATDTASRLELLVRARYALIVLDTVEPQRAEELVRRIASDLHLKYFGWTRSKGLRRGGERGD